MSTVIASGLSPRTLFDSYFRSAEVLLKVYRLLETDEFAGRAPLFAQVREALDTDPEEQLFYLLNDYFLGVVRERAQLPNGFFRQQNMALLLRQSVVAACTALDVYMPALLRKHLPTIIQVKQRNFMPGGREVQTFMQNVRLTVDDHLRLIENPETHYDLLGQFILGKLDKASMSNVTGITVIMNLLDFDDPWATLAARLERKQNDLRTAIDSIVSRRNDIVHRGDRDPRSDGDTLRPIDYAWTSLHVTTVQAVVHACDALVTRHLRELGVLVAGELTA